jgi:hypothetical protein
MLKGVKLGEVEVLAEAQLQEDIIVRMKHIQSGIDGVKASITVRLPSHEIDRLEKRLGCAICTYGHNTDDASEYSLLELAVLVPCGLGENRQSVAEETKARVRNESLEAVIQLLLVLHVHDGLEPGDKVFANQAVVELMEDVGGDAYEDVGVGEIHAEQTISAQALGLEALRLDAGTIDHLEYGCGALSIAQRNTAGVIQVQLLAALVGINQALWTEVLLGATDQHLHGRVCNVAREDGNTQWMCPSAQTMSMPEMPAAIRG